MPHIMPLALFDVSKMERRPSQILVILLARLESIGAMLKMLVSLQVNLAVLSRVTIIIFVNLANRVIVVTVRMEALMTKIVADFQIVHRWFAPKISKIRRLQVFLIQLLLRPTLTSSMVNSLHI